MLLQESDFTLIVANWLDKAQNLRGISQALSLGLDSMVYLDDNPAERALIRQELPDVAVPEFPEDPAELPIFIAEVFAEHFTRMSLTAEDLEKSKHYVTRARGEQLRASATNLEEFYRSLEMIAYVNPLTKDRISRAANAAVSLACLIPSSPRSIIMRSITSIQTRIVSTVDARS